jgi:hypothetical protein
MPGVVVGLGVLSLVATAVVALLGRSVSFVGDALSFDDLIETQLALPSLGCVSSECGSLRWDLDFTFA